MVSDQAVRFREFISSEEFRRITSNFGVSSLIV